jgi:hypothetical protein
VVVDIVADAATPFQIVADGYAGSPLAFSLLLDGKRAHLANLSFAESTCSTGRPGAHLRMDLPRGTDRPPRE